MLKPFKKAHDIQIRRRYHLTLILYKEGQFNATIHSNLLNLHVNVTNLPSSSSTWYIVNSELTVNIGN
ncbi:hypothetical protein, partial [Bacteroides acidifaciens]|uniref:hypothetical protein n=1 Tax=Bacteroides acidifaciens TaxID=85831 RepID=UPI0025B79C0C